MDAPLLTALGGTGVLAAIAAITGAVIKGRTDKAANKTATDKLVLDTEEATRREAERRRKEESEWRSELRTDLEHAEKKCEALEAKAEALAAKLEAARVERDEARQERTYALNHANQTERWLTMRVHDCERIGTPCQPKPLVLPKEDDKAA